jgi:hypothetical protein
LLRVDRVSVGGHRAFSTEPSRTTVTAVPAPGEANRIRADIRNALKKQADRRVLGESYVAEVLIVKGVKGLSPVEMG